MKFSALRDTNITGHGTPRKAHAHSTEGDGLETVTFPIKSCVAG